MIFEKGWPNTSAHLAWTTPRPLRRAHRRQSSLTWQRARAARLRHATPCLPLHPPPSILHPPSSHLPLPFVPPLPLFSCFSLTSPLSLFSSFPPRTFVLTVPHQVSAPHKARIILLFPPPSPPACSCPFLPPPPVGFRFRV
jgi:hypothetical protein